jgi:hypothetical protein
MNAKDPMPQGVDMRTQKHGKPFKMERCKDVDSIGHKHVDVNFTNHI